MKVLALVLTAVMFGAIACESAPEPEPQPDVIVGVVAECPYRTLNHSGAICSTDSFRGYAYWLITVKTSQGTSYEAKVEWSRKPKLGQTWP